MRFTFQGQRRAAQVRLGLAQADRKPAGRFGVEREGFSVVPDRQRRFELGQVRGQVAHVASQVQGIGFAHEPAEGGRRLSPRRFRPEAQFTLAHLGRNRAGGGVAIDFDFLELRQRLIRGQGGDRDAGKGRAVGGERFRGVQRHGHIQPVAEFAGHERLVRAAFADDGGQDRQYHGNGRGQGEYDQGQGSALSSLHGRLKRDVPESRRYGLRFEPAVGQTFVCLDVLLARPRHHVVRQRRGR